MAAGLKLEEGVTVEVESGVGFGVETQLVMDSLNVINKMIKVDEIRIWASYPTANVIRSITCQLQVVDQVDNLLYTCFQSISYMSMETMNGVK